MRITNFKDRMRALRILHLYQIHLNRVPDDGGWAAYYNSKLTIEEIERELISSAEYKEKHSEPSQSPVDIP